MEKDSRFSDHPKCAIIVLRDHPGCYRPTYLCGIMLLGCDHPMCAYPTMQSFYVRDHPTCGFQEDEDVENKNYPRIGKQFIEYRPQFVKSICKRFGKKTHPSGAKCHFAMCSACVKVDYAVIGSKADEFLLDLLLKVPPGKACIMLHQSVPCSS